jgi:putative oxidoreductase
VDAAGPVATEQPVARVQAALMLVARVMMATIFLVEGWAKVGSYDETLAYMQANGVPGRLLPLVMATELCGGALVLVGLGTRVAALALAGFSLLAALVFHRELGSPEQAIDFYKNVAMTGGFLALVACGAGSWSLDALAPDLRAHRRAAGPVR